MAQHRAGGEGEVDLGDLISGNGDDLGGLGIGEFWDTLGGETKSDGKDNHDQTPESNSNKRVQTSEKN